MNNYKVIIPSVMAVGFIACVCISYFSSNLNAFDRYEIVTFGQSASEPGYPENENTPATSDVKDPETGKDIDSKNIKVK